MRRWTGWLLVGVMATGLWLVGCSKDEEVAAAPEQNSNDLPMFPEELVPDPEPQPTAAEPAPPVDTAAKTEAEPMPKESYPPAEAQVKVHVVKKGETLQKISDQYYGTTKNWRKIYNANKDVLKNGPDKVMVGMKLQIP